MFVSFRGISLLALAISVFFGAVSSHAQNQSSAGTAPISTVVTALGPKYTAPPPISQSDVSVYSGKDKQNVTSWVPAQGDKANLELAIVIDDSDRIDIGNQISDIASFIKSQPKSCGVAVFYASNGTVQAASQFSTDHEAVAKSVRLPLGRTAAYSSIYLSLMDLFKRWPVTGARREVLLMADGIDRFRGDPFSPDVDTTIERAQKAGVIIHTLYASGIGSFSRNMFQVNYGQSNLAKMADGTGGEAFFQGLQTPISFSPFLDQLNVVLNNQYWLKFDTPRSKKKNGEMRSIRVRTEQKDVDLSNATRVFVPGGGSE
jgi:VWFA-related protein